MSGKHTKGPWKAGRSDMATIHFPSDEDGYSSKWVYAGKKYIAVASGRDVEEWDEVMANARLISAAPDLLEACQALLAHLSSDGDDDKDDDALERIEWAIAKATGEAEGES